MSKLLCQFSSKRVYVLLVIIISLIISTSLYGISWNRSKATNDKTTNNLYYGAIVFQIFAFLTGLASIFFFPPRAVVQLPFDENNLGITKK